MIVTNKSLSRRTFLRGVGTTVALPFLDAMVPAFATAQTTAPVRRLAVVYVPNGIMMSDWTPATEGPAFDLPRILRPLTPFRGQVTVLSGLRNGPPSYAVHAVASTEFLTGVPPAPSTATVGAGTSMDQLAATVLGQQTRLTSLELALESGYAGACDVDTSCVYNDTISWRGPTMPLPMEHDPRAVFERLFGDDDTTDPAARSIRLRQQRSLLDSVAESLGDLRRGLGTRDRTRVSDYLEAVRDVERRIETTEQQSSRDLRAIERPLGVPDTFPEHARLMFDLQVVAYQSDLTRVITCMMGRELSGRSYPEIGVHDAHHPTSHHGGDPEKLAKLTAINTHHMTQFAYFLERLRSTSDGNGSLLDHATIIYGSGMSDGDAHAQENLPILLAGGGAGRLSGGHHIRVAPDTPIANLHVTLLDTLGVRVDRFSNSTGRLSALSI